MAILTIDTYYLGQLPIIDTDPTNGSIIENGEALEGITADETSGLTYGTITIDDANGDGNADLNDTAPGSNTAAPGTPGEKVTYTNENGEVVTSEMDAIAFVNFDVVLSDGTTQSGVAYIYQLEDGASFLAPLSPSLDGESIQSVTITAASGSPTNPPAWDLLDTSNGGVVCFTRGTLLNTAFGEVPIEELSIGDLVLTQDHGYQPLRWIGSRKLSVQALETNPKLRPVRIATGALGAGLPRKALKVSPQHRIQISSTAAVTLTGSRDVLIPAIKLTSTKGVHQTQAARDVEYFHILFDQHEVVFANGLPAESLFTGPQALKALSPEARDEISAIFPEVLEVDFRPTPARPIVERKKEIRKLLC